MNSGVAASVPRRRQQRAGQMAFIYVSLGGRASRVRVGGNSSPELGGVQGFVGFPVQRLVGFPSQGLVDLAVQGLVAFV